MHNIEPYVLDADTDAESQFNWSIDWLMHCLYRCAFLDPETGPQALPTLFLLFLLLSDFPFPKALSFFNDRNEAVRIY